MPIKDIEKRRAYDRDRKRAKRSGSPTLSPTLLDLPAEYREAKAETVLGTVMEQLVKLREDEEIGTVERARCVAYVAGVALKAIESANLAGRIADLERVIKSQNQS